MRDDLLPLKQVAAIFDVDVRTVLGWIAAGDISGIQLGVRWYVHQDAVDALLKRAGAQE